MPDDADRGPVLYRDDDAVVLASRSNPDAWLRSDTVVSVGGEDPDRLVPERV